MSGREQRRVKPGNTAADRFARMLPSDLLFLLENTVPVAGERWAARESWFNVLSPHVGRDGAWLVIDARMPE